MGLDTWKDCPPEGGEAALCEALIERYGRAVYGIVRRVAGRYAAREDIEECVSDALVALWRARDQYDPAKGDYDHYVAAVARNKAIDLRLRLSRHAGLLPLDEDMLMLDAPGPAEAMERSELSALLSEAVGSLEPPSPEIFVRRYFWGEGLEDIGRALGMSVRAVEGRLYRGRKQLKDWLEGRLSL